MTTRGKPDDGLRPLMRNGLMPLGFDCQSIETGITGGGVPDLNFCSLGIEGWVECKSTSGWTVPLAPEQVGWICRRVRAGGRVFIAVRRRHDGGIRRGPPADELWLLPGGMAKEAVVGGLRALRERRGAVLGMWPGGPTRWPWAVVGTILRA